MIVRLSWKFKLNLVDFDIYYDFDFCLFVDYCVSVYGKLVIFGDMCCEYFFVFVVFGFDIIDYVVKLYDLNYN